MMPDVHESPGKPSGRVCLCSDVVFFRKRAGAMTLGRRVLILASAMVLALGLPSLSRAQSLTGSISGTVADAQGGMLPGADVALTDQNSKTVQRTVTNTEGVFVFASLPAGTYG